MAKDPIAADIASSTDILGFRFFSFSPRDDDDDDDDEEEEEELDAFRLSSFFLRFPPGGVVSAREKIGRGPQ
jgi:hypothetical protein